MPDPTRQGIDLLIMARWLVPVVPAETVLEDVALAVADGTIVGICAQEDAVQRYQPAQTVSLTEHALIPGLINAHGHVAMTLFRGLANDKPVQQWLEEDIWPAEGRWVQGDFVQDGAELGIAEMLLSGTTCFSDMYFFPERVAEAARNAGIRVQLTFPIFDFPTMWAAGPDEYIAKGTELFDEFKHHPLVNVAFGPHAPYTVSRKTLQRVAMLADELQAGVHMHVHENQQEVNQALATDGSRPIRMLRDLGLLNPRMQCVHGCALNEDDLEDLATTASNLVHCPESNLKLASGFCPVAQLQERGINVALGTDGAASNNDLDMLGEMRTAALLAKAVAEDAAAMPASKALEMATINGARALGLESRLGSLEVGKLADIVAVDLGDLRLQPVYNPVAHLAYNQLSDKVSHVWVNGQALVAERKLQTLDEETILARARQWGARITGTGDTP